MKIRLYGVLILIAFTSLAESYKSYEEISSILSKYSVDYPNKVHLYSIGKSVEGRDLWVLAVANSRPKWHVPLRAEVKFIGNIHGNELLTGEILLNYARLLVENPEKDENVEMILNTTRVHILVSMNPDGTKKASLDSCVSKVGRNNSNNLDLNRNFPDMFFCNEAELQPETRAVLNWFDSMRFLLSSTFHTGAMVASYGYENFAHSESANQAKYVATDDDDVLRHLAKQYSLNHKYMATAVCDNETFTDGITNGANWYPPVRGGMQDVNYWKYGCYEVTMEIECCLNPPAQKLPDLWNDNRKALIEFTKAANIGVRGVIKYQNGLPAKYLSVQINSREPIFKTDENGEYYALLLPGYYNMTVMLNCDPIYSTRFYIFDNGLTVLNVTLDNSLYSEAFYYSLDKYALFCTHSKKPFDCTLIGKEKEKNRTNESLTTTSTQAPSSNKKPNGANQIGPLSLFQMLFISLSLIKFY